MGERERERERMGGEVVMIMAASVIVNCTAPMIEYRVQRQRVQIEC